jgi:hypothetical protein
MYGVSKVLCTVYCNVVRCGCGCGVHVSYLYHILMIDSDDYIYYSDPRLFSSVSSL